MRLHTHVAVVLGAIAAHAVLGCNRTDDTELTAQTQARVNQVANANSEFEVSVNDGVVTLSGAASSQEEHARAVDAAKSVPGVRAVRDEIVTPGITTLTGGTVPK